MAAFRYYDPAPVNFDLLGVSHLAAGSLTFYDIGTTTPKDTWSNAALSILNANPVPLVASGRTATNIFLDGSYTVVLKDGLGAVIWTRDVIPGAGGGFEIPALVDGWFLTNDGAQLIWAPILLMPDPTGQDGKVPVATGSGYTLQPFPTAPDPDVVVTATSFQAGISSDPTKFLVQSGTGSAPSSGGRSTTLSIVFDTPYTTLWHVSVSVDGAGFPNTTPRIVFPSKSTTGFTVEFDTDVPSTSGVWDINSPIPFTYVAFGTKEVP